MTTPSSIGELIERVALKLAEAHDAIQNPRKNYAVISYRAGASVDYWEKQARAAIEATGVERLRDALTEVKERCFQANGDANWAHDILSIVVPVLEEALTAKGNRGDD